MRIADLLLGIAVPAVCELCGRQLADGETWLCMHCMASLPLCTADRESIRLQKLPRTAPIVHLDTLLTYAHDNATGALIRLGKYGDRPDIMERLGDMLGRQAADRGILADADVVVPVPMHWWKRCRRGYNQAEIIAGRVGAIAGCPVIPLLKAVKGHKTQTRRSGESRLTNVENTFGLTDPSGVAGRHVVVVDDILTTGATITEAIRALSAASPRAITVLTIASTSR